MSSQLDNKPNKGDLGKDQRQEIPDEGNRLTQALFDASNESFFLGFNTGINVSFSYLLRMLPREFTELHPLFLQEFFLRVSQEEGSAVFDTILKNQDWLDEFRVRESGSRFTENSVASELIPWLAAGEFLGVRDPLYIEEGVFGSETDFFLTVGAVSRASSNELLASEGYMPEQQEEEVLEVLNQYPHDFSERFSHPLFGLSDSQFGEVFKEEASYDSSENEE